MEGLVRPLNQLVTVKEVSVIDVGGSYLLSHGTHHLLILQPVVASLLFKILF